MADGYGKKPLWQWIVIYAIIGLVVYGLIYYFVFAKKGGYSGPSTTVSQNEVLIKDFSFSPATLTIKVGDKVTWTNQDPAGHSATADDKSFDTQVLASGQSGSITFNKAGTYTYYCSIHPKMKGTIVVQ